VERETHFLRAATRIIQSFAWRIAHNLENSRAPTVSHPHGRLSHNNYSITLRQIEAERGKKHNLGVLLSSDMSTLVLAPQSSRPDDSLLAFLSSDSSSLEPPASKNVPAAPASPVGSENDPTSARTAESGIVGDGDASIPTVQVNGLNWTGAALVRGELMSKVFFYLSVKYLNLLEKDSWETVVQLLLWFRSRGCLPDSLAALDDDWFECRTDSFQQSQKPGNASSKSSSTRAPSINACRCHGYAQNVATDQLADLIEAMEEANYGGNGGGGSGSNDGGSSLWSSVKGLLWSQGGGSSGSNSANGDSAAMINQMCASLFAQLPLNANSSMKYRKTVEQRRRQQASVSNKGSTFPMDFATIAVGGYRDMTADDYLRVALHNSPVNDLFVSLTIVEEKRFVDAVSALIDIIEVKLRFLLEPQAPAASTPVTEPHLSQKGGIKTSKSAVGSLDAGASSTDNPPKSPVSSSLKYTDLVPFELEAVTMLEWLAAIVLGNKQRLPLVWSNIQGASLCKS
jgi:uncharacterized membrane protein YgcG